MKTSKYIWTIGLLGVLASCNDDMSELVSPVEQGITRIYATIGDDMADTRTMLVNDKKIFWEVGDKIGVIPTGDFSKGWYQFTYQNDGYFNGSDATGVGTAGTYFAAYPSILHAKDDTKQLLMKLDKDVMYKENSFSQPMPMFAGSTNLPSGQLIFYPAAGVIKVALAGSFKVTKITLEGNNHEQITGVGMLNTAEAKPSLEMSPLNWTITSDKGSIEYVPGYQQVMTMGSGVQLSESPTSFYFVVPPIDFTKGITITMDGEGLSHPIVQTTTNSVKVNRGVMKSFAVVDIGAKLQEEADVQLDALKALYNSTDGANWTANKWDITKPLSDATAWPGVTADAHGVVTKIALANSGLSGSLPDALGNLTFLEEFDLSNNNLSGGIPKEVRNLSSLKKFYVNGNQMNDSVPYVVYTSDAWGYADKKLTQQSGYALKTEYVSSDYSKDGEVKVLQTHDSGKGIGIPLVITCDGYSDDMYDEFNAQAINAMNYFFSIAPYKDFEDFFDVYSLMAVSPNNKVGLNIAFSTEYSGDSYKIAAQKVRHRLDSMSSFDHEKYPEGKNVLTIVLLHETKAEPNRAICFFSSDGFAAAIVPVDDKMESIIHHEAGGHGFAFLGDEYYDAGSTAIFTNLVSLGSDGNPIDINDFHSRGVYWNVDYNNTDTTAKWKDFWTDAAYSSESVGAYPGGMGQYVNGIFHSTPKSTMLNQKEYDKFNPISRWAIYRQIIIRAGFAEPTIAQFKEYDDDNNIAYIPPSLSVVTRSNYVADKSYKLGAPPVIEWK